MAVQLNLFRTFEPLFHLNRLGGEISGLREIAVWF